MQPELLYGIALTAVPILLSLSVHEFAHARTALAFGDPTAKSMGRCTLNPLAHLDPVGTIMLMLVGFGWAKPVPVNSANLHPRRLGDIAVSAAGPGSNLALAGLCGLVLRILAGAGVVVDGQADFRPSDLAVFLLTYTILINLMLCIFNLIPLFPLDGHHIGREILPAGQRTLYMRWQRHYGMWILLALMFGPRLLRGVVNIRVDPMGWYISRALFPTVSAIIGPNAIMMAMESLDKFSGYTPFG